MTAELERYNENGAARGWLDTWAPTIELAKAIAGTSFVSRAFARDPAAVAACILYGAEIGIGPMQSLAKISVIDGRPSLAAETQRGLVLAAGHELWLEELTATRATWCGRRAGSDQITRITWTMDDARRANLAGRQAWRAYPRAMLSARASAELCRAIAPDSLGGLMATEEIVDGAELELEAVPLAPAGTGTVAGKRRRRRPAVAEREVTAPAIGESAPAADLPPLPDELEAEAVDTGDGGSPAAPVPPTAPPAAAPDEPDPNAITGAQRRRMMALFRRLKRNDRADRLRYASELVGRKLSSSNELTTAEADRVIDDLEAEASRAPDENEADDDDAPAE